jgi:hypothetical protein
VHARAKSNARSLGNEYPSRFFQSRHGITT